MGRPRSVRLIMHSATIPKQQSQYRQSFRRVLLVAVVVATSTGTLGCVTRQTSSRDIDAVVRAQVENDLAQLVDKLERDTDDLTRQRDALKAQVADLQHTTDTQAAALEAWRYTFGTLYARATDWARAAGEQIPPVETMVPKSSTTPPTAP